MEIPVRVVDQRPIATLKINGTELPMLVDSGAFFSMLSPSAATQLGLPTRRLPDGLRIQGYTGSFEARMTHVDTVQLLDTELKGVDFVVGGSEINAGIMGVLGRNILSAGDTEYDLAHGAIRLMFPKGDCEKVDLAYWAGKAPVVEVPLANAWNRADTAIYLKVRVNGQDATALMDTGAPVTSLSLRLAKRAGVDENALKPLGRSGGLGQRRVTSWSGLFESFEVGGEKITRNLLPVDDVWQRDQDLLLGLDYVLSHRILVSRLQNKAYITWNGGPVFALNHAAAGVYDPQYAARPEEAPEGDADALARRGAAALAAGDREGALKNLDRAIELAPGIAAYRYDRARVHMAMRKPGLAMADLDQSLLLDPAQPEARMRRALLRAALKDHDGVLADLAQLDAGLPPSASQRADMADLFAAQGRTAEALAQYDKWLGSHPRDGRRASQLNNRCWLRTRLNVDLDKAREDCEEAVDLDEGSPAFRDSLGWTWLRLGQPAKARKSFDAAIALRAMPFALYGRALALTKLQEPSLAQVDLAAARKLDAKVDEQVRAQGFEPVP